MNRNEKEQVITELQKKLKNAKLAILADYSGITVKEITDLRSELRKADSEFKVVKNNLLSIALKDTEFSPLDDHLKGPRALMMNFGDVVEPTRMLVEFAEKNDQLEIEVGVLDGRLLTREQISALAKLPSRDILLAKLLSTMVGVQTQFVTVLSGVPRGLVQVLEAHRVEKEGN